MRPDLTSAEHTLRALKRLPTEEAPPYGWEEFQRRARLRPGRHAVVRAWGSVPGWAVAAGLAVLGAGLMTDVHRPDLHRPAVPQAAAVREPGLPGRHEADHQAGGAAPEAAGTEHAAGVGLESGYAGRGAGVMPGPANAPQRGALQAVSAEYRQPAIVQVDTQMAVGALEDRIAAADDLITAVRLAHPQARQVLALQRDRDQMAESLEQIRQAQLLVTALQ